MTTFNTRLRVLTLLLTGLCLPALRPARAALPWALDGWKYRVPVQAYNDGDALLAAPVLAIADLPFNLLIGAGKLAEDGSDLRLLDDGGKTIPLRSENLLSDNGDARLVFALPELKAHERRLLTLYYGGPGNGERAVPPPQALTAAKELKIGIGAEESATVAAPVTAPLLDRWLAGQHFVEAETGKGAGFAVQPAGAELAPAASGALLAATGGAGDTVTFSWDVEAGTYTCWARVAPGNPPGGTLTLSVEQDGKVLAAPADPLGGAAARAFRWFPLRVTAAKGAVQLIARSSGSRAALDCLLLTRDAQYRPDIRDFQGMVWVRWRIDAPADYRYWGKIYNDWDPYRPIFKYTGIITPSGLLAEVGGPYNAIPFAADDAFFAAGQYSPWVPLPASKAAQWHSVLYFPPKPGGKVPDEMSVRLEFANRPAAERIFHLTPAEPLEKGSATCGVRMPTATTLESLQQLETFTEWALRRYALVKKLRLSPPPHLTKIHVGTWDMLSTRLGGGQVTKARAKIDFEELEALGINMMNISGIDDATQGELAKEYGMVAATWTCWTEGWRYTNEAYNKQYDYKDAAETPPQRWQRVLDDYYGKQIAAAKKNSPNLLALNKAVNLGDEIGQATTADDIAKTPQLLAYFREWLKAHGLAPADFGAADWDGVSPLGDRKALGADEGAKARAFYWTARFQDDYTAMFYRTATEMVQKYLGPSLTHVNYQAGPMQIGWLGNDNDMDKCMMDIFHMGREKAFTGALTEDWVYGWDMGIGRILLGDEMLRATVRKHRFPVSTYLIGGDSIRAKFYANLMLGVKNIDLYLYGPISNVGPAWCESEKALAETAEATREAKKYEDAIATGVVRPRKAALLITPTADIMQKKGLYYLAERQALFVTLAHNNLPVDVVSEAEIEEDNALANYALLYVSDPNVREATQRKIAGWVKGGGLLWACVGGANWDEYNRACPVLNEVFGVSKREMVAQEKWLPWVSAFYGWPSVKFGYQQQAKMSAALPGGPLEVPAWGVTLDCAPTTAKVLGTYEDGKPALLLNSYGRGQALLAGALVGEAYLRQHYPDDIKSCGKIGWSFDGGAQPRRLTDLLTAAAKITRPVTLSVPGIYTSVMDSPTGTLVFLNNATQVAIEDAKEAQTPTVTARVLDARKVKSVESANLGKLKFTQKNGVVTFQLKLPHPDMIFLKH